MMRRPCPHKVMTHLGKPVRTKKTKQPLRLYLKSTAFAVHAVPFEWKLDSVFSLLNHVIRVFLF